MPKASVTKPVAAHPTGFAFLPALCNIVDILLFITPPLISRWLVVDIQLSQSS